MDTEDIRILLVEDSIIDMTVFCRQLVTMGGVATKVAHAPSLESASRLLHRDPFDLVVVDLVLPDGSGEESFHAVYAAAPELPIIVLTGINNEALGIRLLQQGAEDYLVKGQFGPEVLQRSIRYAIERKQAREELQRASQLAALGTLAAGIAQEVSKPLSEARAAAQAALDVVERSGDVPLSECLQEVAQSVRRCADIVDNVNLLSQRGPSTRRRLRLDQIVEDAVVGFQTQNALDACSIAFDFQESEPWAFVNVGELQQVVCNLLRNAVEAADGPLQIRIGLSREGDQFRLSFEDDGLGIAKHTLPQVFKPFFTTRSDQGCVGLGLSITHRVVEDHGGRIEIQPRSPRGTIVCLELPCCDAELSPVTL